MLEKGACICGQANFLILEPELDYPSPNSTRQDRPLLWKKKAHALLWVAHSQKEGKMKRQCYPCPFSPSKLTGLINEGVEKCYLGMEVLSKEWKSVITWKETSGMFRKHIL